MTTDSQQLEERSGHVGIVHPWPRLLDVPHLAAYLGLAEQTVRNHAAEIPGRRKFGRKVIWDIKVVDSWLDRNEGTSDLWLDARKMAG